LFVGAIIEERMMVVEFYVGRRRRVESVESVATDAQDERTSPKSWESRMSTKMR